jgi:hypothetical protein
MNAGAWFLWFIAITPYVLDGILKGELEGSLMQVCHSWVEEYERYVVGFRILICELAIACITGVRPSPYLHARVHFTHGYMYRRIFSMPD